MLSVVFLIVILSLFAISSWRKNSLLPPGPWNIPIIGSLLWLNAKEPYKTLHEFAKKYGSIYGLYMGNIYTVVLSDAKLIKKVLSKEVTTGRAPLYVTHGLMKGCGLICAQGDLWKDQRKFVFNFLRNIGGAKVSSQRTAMEKLILKHANGFVEYVESKGESSSFRPLEHLRHAVGSFMNEIVFGESWSKEDETWIYLQHLQEEGTKYIGIAGPVNFIPILRFLPEFRRNLKFLQEGLEITHKLYDDIIEKHRQALEEDMKDPNFEPCNLLDAFLYEKHKKKNSAEGEFYSDQQLRYLLADMFGAGLDTTLTTLSWYLLFISLNEDFQKLVHEELSTVLQGKPATMSDFQYLPYFEASIAEVQRIRSTVPVGIPHGTLGPIEIEGYRIPKGTMIIPLQWAVHMDDDAWGNPEIFDPRRFIDDNGRFFRPDNLIPFQSGKRICVGEELAKMLLYLFASAILQKYELSVNRREAVNLNGDCGITLSPDNYEIVFKQIKT
ncbi:cytochrome P450 306a1 [Coccinella septempunctata]|uniref:cytochrome P450 306a1 n=1 Tax=Coccinella septempunctata TaxID=41139 RepID=UPI001D09201B|nr:cytochrome P450 306a1 [Coccinella septempunctata]